MDMQGNKQRGHQMQYSPVNIKETKRMPVTGILSVVASCPRTFGGARYVM